MWNPFSSKGRKRDKRGRFAKGSGQVKKFDAKKPKEYDPYRDYWKQADTLQAKERLTSTEQHQLATLNAQFEAWRRYDDERKNIDPDAPFEQRQEARKRHEQEVASDRRTQQRDRERWAAEDAARDKKWKEDSKKR